MASGVTAEPDETDDDLIKRVGDDYRLARDHQSLWRREARKDFDFYAGEQWDAEAKAILADQQRPMITFNRTAPIVDAIVGYEINNRQETRFIPRTQGDAPANEVLTNAAEWIQDECDADTEDTAAFRDAVISGMGWSETRLSDDQNPDMDVVREKVDPLEMAWDPSARKPNLTDRRWQLREKFYAPDEFKAMFPDSEFGQDDMSAWESGIADDDEGTSERFGYTGEKTTTSNQSKLIRVWHYQWKDYITGYKALNPTTGQPEEIDKATLDKVKKAIPDLPSTSFRKVVVREAFIAGGEVLKQGDAPDPKQFTYSCITGKHDRNKNLWYGVIRPLRDPQEWQNKWLSQSMHIMNSNAKGGVMAEKDAVADVSEFEKSWADSSAISWLNPGGSSKIQPKPQGQINAGTDRLLQLAMQSFGEVSGVNAEMMGMADREQAGVLEYQRKQAAVTILAPLFDSLRRFRKLNGRLLVHFIRTYISDGRLIRVSEQGMDKYVQLLHDDQVIEFDVIVDQSSTSPNEKERVFAILQQLIPMLPKEMITPDVLQLLLEYTPLPDSLTEKIKQLKQQPNPAQQEAQQLEKRQGEAVAAKDESVAELNQAKAHAEQASSATNLIKTGHELANPQPVVPPGMPQAMQ